jgi:beta-phosphoglucomutase
MTSGDNGAVIWDVDGTLVDTAELHFQAWDELCRELGRPFSRADFAATFGQRNPEIFKYLFGDRFSAAEVDELGNRKEDFYRSVARRKGVELLPGVRALLAGLHEAGFKQAIGSSAPLVNIELILGITRSSTFFDAVSSAEDTQRGKPDPQVFQVAARKLGVPAEKCVVVEDAVAGVQAAKAGAMKCIAVSFVGHHPEEKLRAAGADLVVRTLEQVSVQAVRDLLSGVRV